MFRTRFKSLITNKNIYKKLKLSNSRISIYFLISSQNRNVLYPCFLNSSVVHILIIELEYSFETILITEMKLNLQLISRMVNHKKQ